MASSAVNQLNNLTLPALYNACMLKHCDRICTVYSQQSARCLIIDPCHGAISHKQMCLFEYLPYLLHQ